MQLFGVVISLAPFPLLHLLSLPTTVSRILGWWWGVAVYIWNAKVVFPLPLCAPGWCLHRTQLGAAAQVSCVLLSAGREMTISRWVITATGIVNAIGVHPKRDSEINIILLLIWLINYIAVLPPKVSFHPSLVGLKYLHVKPSCPNLTGFQYLQGCLSALFFESFQSKPLPCWKPCLICGIS